MYTSNFNEHGNERHAIAISIGTPRGWKGRRYLPLAPTRAMLKMGEADYAKHYTAILEKLNPQKVFADLARLGTEDAILLCWEEFNVRCHRRWVAEWLEKSLGIEIPELGHERCESLPFDEQQRKQKAKKEKTGLKNQLLLLLL